MIPPFFFFNDTATTEIYTLSLHDALPIFIAFISCERTRIASGCVASLETLYPFSGKRFSPARSEEHTSELQSLAYLVCRLLLEKKKIIIQTVHCSTQAPDLSYRRSLVHAL